MDHRDLDRWARLIASSCSRRRTLHMVGAGALAFGIGRRSRFDSLAAELGCCKCSGTLRCELDVATYGECVTVCGPRRQAIFAPNYTCTRGNSLSSVCKPKRRATGLALLAGAPGVYDLAFVNRAAAATIPGLFPVTTEALFTAAAAIAAGFVQETAAAALFEGGVQVYHSLWRDAGETLGVFSHLSQHLTAEAATRWYDYALPQLGPAGAETFDFELSGIDAGTLVRFAFPSQTQPGVTITRLMAMTLTGEFVNWFGIDGHDTVPDPELTRTFAQAIVDALIDRPEQTESLAPYVALLPGAAACLPAFPTDSAKRAGASAARGPAGFQDPSAECEAPTGNIRYPVWDGAYVPRFGAADEVIELNQRFLAGADRVLDQSYAVGNQIRTVTIANWWHADAIADGGEIFFARRAEVDAARGAVRQDLDMPHAGASGRWFCTAVAFPAGEQWMYGVDAVAFAPPYSLTLGVLQPGPPIGDPSTWTAAEDPAITEELWPVIDATEEAMGLDDWHVTLTGVGDQQLATYGSALGSPPQDDEVVSGGGEADPTALRDLAEPAAMLGLSPSLTGLKSNGGVTYLTSDAAARALVLPERDIEQFLIDRGPKQARHDTYVTDDGSRQLDLTQWEFPDQATAEAALDALIAALSRSGDDPYVRLPGANGYILEYRDFVEARVRHIEETLFQHDEIVVTGTYETISSEPKPSEDPTELAFVAMADLLVGYQQSGLGGPIIKDRRPLTRWVPVLNDQDVFPYDYDVVGGEEVPGAGYDGRLPLLPLSGERHRLIGSYDLGSEDQSSPRLGFTWEVREFADKVASNRYWEQMPDAMLSNGWRPTDQLTLDLGIRYEAYGGVFPQDDGRYRLGANLTFQDETFVVGYSAFVDTLASGDQSELDNENLFASRSWFLLGEGLADLTHQVHTGQLAVEDREYEGRLPSIRHALPRSWQDFYSDETLASEEANPTLLRDFAATTVDLLSASDVADFEIAGGTTYLTPSSLDSPGVQEYVVGARRRLAGKGFVQAHVSSYHSPNLNADQPQDTPAYENLFLTQVQYTDEEAVAAVFDWFEAELASLNPEGTLLTTSIPGGTTQIISAESQVETEYGLTRRLSTVARAGRYIATGTYDRVGPLPSAQGEGIQERINAEYAILIRSYDDDRWGGEVGQEARRVVPWVPLVEGLDEFRHYYGIVGGEVVPRAGVPAEQMAAENPGVRTALFGSFFLTGGWAPTAVYFDVRDFPDQEASDEYFEQLPDLFQTYRGPDWIFAQSHGPYVESLVRHHEHGATWTPAEGTYLVGTHIATQVGTIVVGIGAFIPFTGDAAAFAELDPLTHPSYDRLRGGAFAMMEELIAERGQAAELEAEATRDYFLPRRPLRIPEDWR